MFFLLTLINILLKIARIDKSGGILVTANKWNGKYFAVGSAVCIIV